MKILYLLLVISLAIFLLLNIAILSSFAAELPATSKITQSEAIYPVKVDEHQLDDTRHLTFTYYITPDIDPSTIPTADFEREGYNYTLLDIIVNHNSEMEQEEYSEIVTAASDSDDTEANAALFAETLEVATPDGYTGLLKLDTESITTEASDYSSYSRTISASRTYPGLSIADTSLLPKTVEEDGHTLDLTTVEWQEINGLYTATASYSGSVSSSYASEFIVSATYKGVVNREVNVHRLYTVTFSGTKPEIIEEGGFFNLPSLLQGSIWLAGGAVLSLATMFVVKKVRRRYF